MQEIGEKLDLFHSNQGVVRIPFLVKGKIKIPPEIGRKEIEAAFRGADKDTLYRKLPKAQLIREPVIDRQSWGYSGEYLYQVLPAVDGKDMVETDIDKLVERLYGLTVKEILDYLSSVSATLTQNQKWLAEASETIGLTAGYCEAFSDAWSAAFRMSLDGEAAKAMIDNELALWGRPGSSFLNGWMEVPAKIVPGLTAALAQGIFQKELINSHPAAKTLIRAMPTRQLHITAGNAPDVPIISALRAILTKSAAVIKLPYGATITGGLFALAAAAAEPQHPLTQNLSTVYWQGGDESIESVLFSPNAFDRIVVWGSPETVAAVQSRALYTRTIYLNPRYGVSLIGREAFKSDLEEAVLMAAVDSMVYNQKACTASLVHYVEGTEEQANQYAGLLQKALGKWDSAIPNFIEPAKRGQLKRLKRGKWVTARWYVNIREEEIVSGTVVMPDEIEILDHPMCRLVVVRPVNDLKNALQYLHQGVSTAGIYPEERREALRDVVLARGVSNVLPLGQCERLFAGMPHDGMPILNQLVDWKNA